MEVDGPDANAGNDFQLVYGGHHSTGTSSSTSSSFAAPTRISGQLARRMNGVGRGLVPRHHGGQFRDEDGDATVQPAGGPSWTSGTVTG